MRRHAIGAMTAMWDRSLLSLYEEQSIFEYEILISIEQCHLEVTFGIHIFFFSYWEEAHALREFLSLAMLPAPVQT